MMIVTTFVPIFSLLTNERIILSDRRAIVNQLHDELQPHLWNNSPTAPTVLKKTVRVTPVTFDFTMENELIKGCANWKNVKKIKETICLYGYPQK